MTELITNGFDYDSLDDDTKSKLVYFTKSAHALRNKMEIEFIAKFGEILSGARKELSKHGDGTFIKWATAEFDISKDTLYRYVNAWDRCLYDRATNWQNLSVSALYLLTQEKTPTSVLSKAGKLAEKQTKVVKADIVRLIEANSKTSQPKPPQNSPESNSSAIPNSSEVETGDAVEWPDSEEDENNQPTSIASIVLDSAGVAVPGKFREHHQLSITLLSVGRNLDSFRKQAKELNEKSGGEWLQMQAIDDGVRTLKGHFQQAAYHTICPQCKGDGCKKCEQAGWLPEYLKGTI